MMRRTLTVLFAATLLLAPVWSATLLRRGLADDPPECPANQKYQPEVNLGCPRSCDQPTPLCKNWPVGPGCGCPKFTVLAGTSRPRTPQRCIDPRDCLRIDPLCPDGAYPLDRPSECGPSGKPCPEGSFCNTDPIDRFAVCCPDPDDVPPPSPPQCVVTGCNGEVCTDHPNDITTICVVPSCAVTCLITYGTCTSDNQHGSCGWDTSAEETDYQRCLVDCDRGHD